MGRPFRSYIGFATNQSSYTFFNTLGGIATFDDVNQLRASVLTITGGTLIPGASTPDGKDYRIFDSPGTLEVIGGNVSCDVMLIAGGGGGGGRLGGGGGAGGYLYRTSILLTPGTSTITIGDGGAADPVTFPNSQGTAQRGDPSTLSTGNLTLKAWGGGGGSADNGGNSTAGGSGGGGAGNAGGTGSVGLNPTTPSAIISSDFPGESHPYAYTQGYNGASIGGGGGAGASAPSGNGDGGVGVKADIDVPSLYGTPGPSPGRWFCGGGGSSFYPGPAGSGGVGGAGGGGNGSTGAAVNGTDGTDRTGGGGGGGGQNPGLVSGAGGSGICVLRFN